MMLGFVNGRTSSETCRGCPEDLNGEGAQQSLIQDALGRHGRRHAFFLDAYFATQNANANRDARTQEPKGARLRNSFKRLSQGKASATCI